LEAKGLQGPVILPSTSCGPAETTRKLLRHRLERSRNPVSHPGRAFRSLYSRPIGPEACTFTCLCWDLLYRIALALRVSKMGIGVMWAVLSASSCSVHHASFGFQLLVKSCRNPSLFPSKTERADRPGFLGHRMPLRSRLDFRPWDLAGKRPSATSASLSAQLSSLLSLGLIIYTQNDLSVCI
jgi:hypothetical protein